MQLFVYSTAAWTVLVLCGLPIAHAVLPPALRRFALPAAVTFAYAYIVFVGYWLYRTNLGGTNAYAFWLIGLPVVALLALVWRRRIVLATLVDRDALNAFALAALAYAVLSWFFWLAGGRAVAMSMSNFDIMELAGVSRYLQEFARDTTIGFMGQSPQFIDTGDAIWFGPSIIVAVMSSALLSDPFRLQSLVMTVVAAQGAAFVYLTARDSLGLDRPVAFGIGVVYAVSPVIAFLVWQSFGGQMIAVPLLLAATWVVTRAQNQPSDARTQSQYLPVLLLLFAGLLVTYHFVIAVLCAMFGLYILIIAVVERSARRLWSGAVLMTGVVLLTVTLNPLRLPGIITTLSWLSGGANGWFIPWLSPDVQIGMNGFNVLGAATGLMPRRLIGAGVAVAMLAATAVHLIRDRRQPAHLAFIVALAAPAILLGAYYAMREAEHGALGGYRSFKMTATFTGFTVIALSLWLGGRTLRLKSLRGVAAAAIAAVLVVWSVSDVRSIVRTTRATVFIPSEELRQLGGIEAMPNVAGVNIATGEMHETFWAHYFTLRKPQAFEEFVYGGRPVGALTQPYTLVPRPQAAGAAAHHPCIDERPIGARWVLCRAQASS